jgi:hypothetical protein
MRSTFRLIRERPCPFRILHNEEKIIMAQVLCEVSEGLRNAEATVKLVGFDGRPEFLPVDRGLLSEEGNRHFLSIPIIHINQEKKAALIALPVEADSGAHRIWVHLDRIKRDNGAPE